MSHTEPWYHTTCMSHEDAEQHLFMCLKHEYANHEKLTQYIKQIVSSEKELGSVRGYWTFLHTRFKNEIIDKFSYYETKTSKILE